MKNNNTGDISMQGALEMQSKNEKQMQLKKEGQYTVNQTWNECINITNISRHLKHISKKYA